MLFIAVIEIAHRRTYIQNDFGISLGLVLSANGFVIWNLSWTRWCPCFVYLWLLPDRKFVSWFHSVVWSNFMLKLLVQIKKSTGEVSSVTYAGLCIWCFQLFRSEFCRRQLNSSRIPKRTDFTQCMLNLQNTIRRKETK